MDELTNTLEQITITTCEDQVKLTGKKALIQHGEQINIHTKQLKELQLAFFTLNQVLHVFRDKGLNSLEQQWIALEKRTTHLEEYLLHSSDEEPINT
jgi:hypothetical protein